MRGWAVAVAVAAVLVPPGAAAPAGASGTTTLFVTTASDVPTGGCDVESCTLREAIDAANALPDGATATITFAVPGPLPVTIRPRAPLPFLGQPTTVDGTTQPGYTGTPVVELDLRASGALTVWTEGTVTVRGLALNRSPDDGVAVEVGDLVLERCFVGTDVTGTADLGNAGNGVFVGYSGGVTAVLRDNLVSGNGLAGIEAYESTYVAVRGNRIGTDVGGTAALPNAGGGLVFTGVPGIVEGNLVSGNGRHGITASDWHTGTPYVVGNLVGTDVTGTALLPNRGDGLHLGPGYFRVGSAGQPNVVAGNRGNGITVEGRGSFVIEGNRIGTDLSGRRRLGNGGGGIATREVDGESPTSGRIGGELRASGNVVAFNARAGIEIADGRVAVGLNELHANRGLGIDLGADGVTANDPGDADAGPNGGQNFPVVTSATSSGGATRVAGTVESTPSTTFRVDVYTAAVCDPAGYGEALRVLGTVVLTTDADGQAAFDHAFARGTSAGRVVTATATGFAHELPTGTSELSACTAVTTG